MELLSSICSRFNLRTTLRNAWINFWTRIEGLLVEVVVAVVVPWLSNNNDEEDVPRSVVDVTLRMRRMRSRILIIRKIGLREAKGGVCPPRVLKIIMKILLDQFLLNFELLMDHQNQIISY